MKTMLDGVCVRARNRDLFAAGLKALNPRRRGRYYYYQAPSGSVYMLNRPAILAAGAAAAAGIPAEQWMPEWIRRYTLKEISTRRLK